MPPQASTKSAEIVSSDGDESRSNDEISIITNNDQPEQNNPSVSPLPTSEQLVDAYPQGVRMPDMPDKEDDDDRWKRVHAQRLAMIEKAKARCPRPEWCPVLLFPNVPDENGKDPFEQECILLEKAMQEIIDNKLDLDTCDTYSPSAQEVASMDEFEKMMWKYKAELTREIHRVHHDRQLVCAMMNLNFDLRQQGGYTDKYIRRSVASAQHIESNQRIATDIRNEVQHNALTPERQTIENKNRVQAASDPGKLRRKSVPNTASLRHLLTGQMRTNQRTHGQQ